jgi:hypothetical protein
MPVANELGGRELGVEGEGGREGKEKDMRVHARTRAEGKEGEKNNGEGKHRSRRGQKQTEKEKAKSGHRQGEKVQRKQRHNTCIG